MSTYFGSAAIAIDVASVPASQSANVTERHIPGGAISYVDIGGRSFSHLTLTLKWDNLADYVSQFEGLVGTRANLVCFDGMLDAKLLSVNRTPFGVSGGGKLVSGSLTPGGAVQVTCEFLVYAVLTLPSAGALASVPNLASFTVGMTAYSLFVQDGVSKSQQLVYSARHMPATNSDYIDDQGPGLPHISTSIVFADSLHYLQFTTACLGLQGTLALREGSYSAIPVSVDRTDHSAQGGGPCTATVDWLLCTGNAVVRTPVCRVQYADPSTQLETITTWPYTLSDVYAPDVNYGYDMRVAEATVTVPVVPSTLGYGSPIAISIGADGTDTMRFQGYVVQFDSTLAASSIDIVCRGELWKAQVRTNQTGAPIDLSNLGGGRSDAEIADALLAYAEVWHTTPPDPTFAGITPGDGSSYSGSAAPLLGTINQVTYVWATNQTILDCLDQLEQIGLGYRTFDTVGGLVVRQRVSVVIPTAPTAVKSYTEGVDILTAANSGRFSWLCCCYLPDRPWLRRGLLLSCLRRCA